MYSLTALHWCMQLVTGGLMVYVSSLTATQSSVCIRQTNQVKCCSGFAMIIKIEVRWSNEGAGSHSGQTGNVS